jgi:hypothetical protein
MIVVRRRVACAMFLGLLVIGLSGCSTDTGDQTNNRLKDLPYTLDVVGQEYVSRFQAMEKPSSEGAQLAIREGGIVEHGGGGPSSAPQTLEMIADDILTKLRRVDTLPKSEQVPAFENWLKSSSKLDEKSVQTLITAMQQAVAHEPVES